MIEVFLTVDWQ